MLKIFIANRGEIAHRVAQTAALLNMETVSIARRGARPSFIGKTHYVAEETVGLYLDAERLLAIAQAEGCDAVHPGYGFLAENADFATKVTAAGLVWIGPAADTIRRMGDKHVARQIAIEAGLPVVPGIFCPTDRDDSTIEEFTRQYTPPYLIKPVAGGGGKGMRVVEDKKKLLSVVKAVAREAQSLYHNSDVIVERCLAHPRHIEVQILGDKQGKLVVLGDRECSVQRRFQKIIEEACAPRLAAGIREKLRQAALNLGTHVSYYSTGTVEFLVDADEFYFLEMNTRLQVEHPVTEEIYGLDLVAWQIKVACDESLDTSLAKREPCTHSIQARIYAEDAERDFLPVPGELICFKPFPGRGIRWEMGQDTQVSSAFDPMLAKVIVTAENRELAIKRLQLVLANTFIVGIKTNLSFLQAVITQQAFVDAQLTVNFVAENMQTLLLTMQGRGACHETAIADISQALQEKFSYSVNQNLHNIFRHKKFREQTQIITLEETGPVKTGDGIYGEDLFFRFAVWQREDRTVVAISIDGHLHQEESAPEVWQDQDAEKASTNSLISPVPGRVAAVNVKAGDTVVDGDICLIVESMKMEFVIKAQGKGKIAKVWVKTGNLVQDEQTLVTFI